jgi:hypothetical protein
MRNTNQIVALCAFLGGCAGSIPGEEPGNQPPGTVNPKPPTGKPNPPDPVMPDPPTPPATLPEEPRLKDVFACDPNKTALGGPRLWRMTAAQYNNTVARLLGLPGKAIAADVESVFAGSGDSVLINSSSALRVQEAQAGPLRTLARTSAATVTGDANLVEKVFNANGNCPAKPASYGNAACVEAFIKGFGTRAFRRPLETAEVTDFKNLFDVATKHGASLDNGQDLSNMGVRAVIEAMLQSPNFLYRVELPSGKGRVALAPYEMASALSYFLTDNMPDTELLAAAAKGELSTTAQIAAHAQRLLDSQGKPAVAEMFHQWLNYEEMKSRQKDERLFPQWKDLQGPLTEELDRFVSAVVFDRKGKFKDLFETNSVWVNKVTAPLYGATVADDSWKEIQTNPAQRSGLLTLAGFMAHTAVLERTSPVNRGLLVQDRLFCTHVPDPPDDVDLSIPALPPNLTRRQQLEAKTAPLNCAACHGLMNGIGFGLENLDAIGKYRDKEENGLAIDNKGWIKGTTDSDGDFVGSRGLATALVNSRQAKECFAIQGFRYAVGRSETPGDACSLRQAYAEFVSAGYDLKTLFVALAKTEAFRFRNVP